MFGKFKRGARSSAPDGEIVSLSDIVALTKRLGAERVGEIIRDKANSGDKFSQNFLSSVALHQSDRLKLSPADNATMYKKAEQFTRMAAESGEKEAQFNLSLMLIRKVDISGEYISREHIEHIKEGKLWADKSAAQGYKRAFDLLKDFEALKRFL